MTYPIALSRATASAKYAIALRVRSLSRSASTAKNDAMIAWTTFSMECRYLLRRRDVNVVKKPMDFELRVADGFMVFLMKLLF